MKSIVSAMVNLGFGSVPVGVASAVSTAGKIEFTTLHTCQSPIKNQSPKSGKTPPAKTASTVSSIQKRPFCPACNKEAEETVRGYEVMPKQFVIVSDEELDQIKPPDTKEIVVSKFVPSNEVTSIMIEKSYFLLPNQHAESSYGVLYQALAETKSAAIGSQWLWQRTEHPCAIQADQTYSTGGILMLHVLREAQDFVQPDFSSPIPSKEDKKLMKELILAQRENLEATDLVSAQRTRLEGLIAAKIAGKEAPTVEVTAPVPDLVEALRASLAKETVK